MDEPAHETYRRLFSAAVSRPVVDRWQPVLEAAAARGLARLSHATAAGGAGGVAPLPYIEQIVFESWARVFFGVDDASADARRLADSFAIIDARSQRRFSSASIVAALESIESCIRRATLPSVIREVLERKSDALADATIIRNLIFIFSTSAGDVSGLLMWVLKHLSDHPSWADRIRADISDGQVPAAGPGSSVAARVVSETLRLQQSEFVMREIVRPITHAGFRFPRGWLLRICVRESHWDPAVFEHPEVFDPDRFLRSAPTRDQYAPFGLDRHACIGEHLARGMAEAFARALAGCTWDVVSDGPTEMSRRRHLAPSPRFRIRLAAPINADLTTRGGPRR
jgi:cytochrome P450